MEVEYISAILVRTISRRPDAAGRGRGRTAEDNLIPMECRSKNNDDTDDHSSGFTKGISNDNGRQHITDLTR